MTGVFLSSHGTVPGVPSAPVMSPCPQAHKTQRHLAPGSRPSLPPAVCRTGLTPLPDRRGCSISQILCQLRLERNVFLLCILISLSLERLCGWECETLVHCSVFCAKGDARARGHLDGISVYRMNRVDFYVPLFAKCQERSPFYLVIQFFPLKNKGH